MSYPEEFNDLINQEQSHLASTFTDCVTAVVLVAM